MKITKSEVNRSKCRRGFSDVAMCERLRIALEAVEIFDP